MVLGGEGLKVWGAVNFGTAIADFKLASIVPDGVDADAFGNFAYEVAKGAGVQGSKLEIIGLLGDVMTGGKSLAKSAVNAHKVINFLKALVGSTEITNDLKKNLEARLEELREDEKRREEEERKRKEEEEERES